MSAGVQIIPAGGMHAIGEKNGLIIRYGEDAVLIDWGQRIPQFDLREIYDVLIKFEHMDDLPDEYFPDQSLLNDLNILALCITHAHQDHYAGWHRIYRNEGKYARIPVITSPFTSDVVSMQARKSGRTRLPSFIWDENTWIHRGPFWIKRFPVNHSVLGSSGFLVKVGGKTIAHLGDFKLWHKADINRNGNGSERVGAPDMNERTFGALREEGPPDAILVDSTYGDVSGFTVSERTVAQTLESILEKERGRVFITLISSNSGRIASTARYAQRSGRPVYIAGRSMQDFARLDARIEGWRSVARRASFWGQGREKILLPPPNAWPDNSVIFVTGSQGEPHSFLDDMANGRFDLDKREGDTLIAAQSVIPVSEIRENVRDTLGKLSGVLDRIYVHGSTPPIASRGAEILTVENIHSSGHERADGKRWALELSGMLEPQAGLVVPCHGGRRLRELLARRVSEWGGRPYLLDDGETLEL